MSSALRQLDAKVDRLAPAAQIRNIGELEPQQWGHPGSKHQQRRQPNSSTCSEIYNSIVLTGKSDVLKRENQRVSAPLQLKKAGDEELSSDVLVQLHHMNKQLSIFADAVGVPGQIGGSTKDDDCKRLKERLRGALDNEKKKKSFKIANAPEVWLEYIFGIAKPDRKKGIRGSRSETIFAV